MRRRRRVRALRGDHPQARRRTSRTASGCSRPPKRARAVRDLRAGPADRRHRRRRRAARREAGGARRRCARALDDLRRGTRRRRPGAASRSPTPAAASRSRCDAFDELVDGLRAWTSTGALRDLRRLVGVLPPRGRLGRAGSRSACSARYPTPARAPRSPTSSASRCSSPTSCATSSRTAAMGRVYLPPRTSTGSAATPDADRAAPTRSAALVRFEAERARGAGSPRAASCCRCSTAAARRASAPWPGIYRRLLDRIDGRPGRRARAAAVAADAGRRRWVAARTPGRSRAPSSRVGAGRTGSWSSAAAWPGSPPRSRCADAGAEVTLLEARPRLGGADVVVRAATACVDNGQHVFLRCCTAYRALPRPDRRGRRVSCCRTGSTSRSSRPARPAGAARAATRCPRRCTSAGRCSATAHLAGRERCGPCAPRSRCGGSTRDDPALDARDVRRAGWPRTASRPRRSTALWDLIALPDPQPRRPHEPRSALAAMVFQTGLLDRRRRGRHRLVARARSASCTASRPRARSAARGRRRAHRRTASRASRRARRRGRGVSTLGDGTDRRRRGRPRRAPPTPPPRCCPPAALARLGPAAPRLGTSPIVNVHVVLRPAGHRPRRSPPASARRCSGCSTAPRRPGSGDGPVPGGLAVRAPTRYIGRPAAELVARDHCRAGRAASRRPRAARSSTPSSPASARATFRPARDAPRCGPAARTACPGCTSPARGPTPGGRRRWRARCAAARRRGRRARDARPRRTARPMRGPRRGAWSRDPTVARRARPGARRGRAGPARRRRPRCTRSCSARSRYHLGWGDADGSPTSSGGGKGVRPALALLSAEAVGRAGRGRRARRGRASSWSTTSRCSTTTSWTATASAGTGRRCGRCSASATPILAGDALLDAGLRGAARRRARPAAPRAARAADARDRRA